MSNLVEKLKKSRQKQVVAGDKTFIITRPTQMEAMEWLTFIDGSPLSSEAVQSFATANFSLTDIRWRSVAQTAIERFVVGWVDIREMDIVPGGDGSALEFDRNLFLEWVKDYPSIIATLGFHVLQAWVDYISQQEGDEKK